MMQDQHFSFWSPARQRVRRTPRWFRLFARHSRGIIGTLIVLVVASGALAAPLLAPRDPIETDLPQRLQPPSWIAEGGNGSLLGTDQLGRDLLSRVLYGARVSLVVGLASVMLSGATGTLLGLLSGYHKGRTDQLLMLLTDIQMAFPFIVLVIAVIAVLGSSVLNMVLVLAIAGWVVYARLVRAQTLSFTQREFVQAARAIGCSDMRIIARHIFPNILSPVIIVGTYQIAQMILAEAALSFLGLGVQPPTPSWGNIISEGRQYIDQAWWVITFPGVVLMFTILGIGFLGDWVREILDPTIRV